MTIKLLTEHHLEFLSLKGGCTCLAESTLVKMLHCWKSHVTALNMTQDWHNRRSQTNLCISGSSEVERGPEPLHPGKSQLATDLLRNTGTDPLKKQLDPKGQKAYYQQHSGQELKRFILSDDVYTVRIHLLT